MHVAQQFFQRVNWNERARLIDVRVLPDILSDSVDGMSLSSSQELDCCTKVAYKSAAPSSSKSTEGVLAEDAAALNASWEPVVWTSSTSLLD
jgi:hypothetical protein